MWGHGGRDAAGARLARRPAWRGPNDLHGRDGFPAPRAPPGMARLVSRPYPRAADGTRLSRLAALRGGCRDPLALSREVESAALFDSEAYRSRGGPASTGEWRQLQTNWHRNLLDGLDETPEVPIDAHLLVLRDALGIPAVPGGLAVSWLRGVGLDRTIEECGLAVLDDPAPVL